MNTTVYLNIGSNQGDRRAIVARAVAAVSALSFPVVERSRVSAAVESAPWGYDSDSPFLNVGVALDCRIDAPWTVPALHRLLDSLQAIERSIGTMPHRNADGSYRDRDLDIDIVAVDGLTVVTPRLVLPHPHMAARSFVLEPMAALAPGWRHPLTGLSASEMLLSIK